MNRLAQACTDHISILSVTPSIFSRKMRLSSLDFPSQVFENVKVKVVVPCLNIWTYWRQVRVAIFMPR